MVAGLLPLICLNLKIAPSNREMMARRAYVAITAAKKVGMSIAVI
jgi:hypothetical protein